MKKLRHLAVLGLALAACSSHRFAAPDLSRLLDQALTALHPALSYQIRNDTDGSAVARFSTKEPGSFQIIALRALSQGCDRDTLAPDFQLDSLSFGTGGKSFRTVFCAHNRRYELIDSNRLKEGARGHALALGAIGLEIQRILTDP